MTSKWGTARAAVAITGLPNKNDDFLEKGTETVPQIYLASDPWPNTAVRSWKWSQ